MGWAKDFTTGRAASALISIWRIWQRACWQPAGRWWWMPLLERAQRDLFRDLARRLKVDFRILDIRVDPDTLRERVRVGSSRQSDNASARSRVSSSFNPKCGTSLDPTWREVPSRNWRTSMLRSVARCVATRASSGVTAATADPAISTPSARNTPRRRVTRGRRGRECPQQGLARQRCNDPPAQCSGRPGKAHGQRYHRLAGGRHGK